MSMKYKLVFCLAIFILLANISIAIVSIGDKASSGTTIPILLSIYVIWKMWSRDNKALTALFAGLFWLGLVASILGFLLIAWGSKDKPEATGYLLFLAAFLLSAIFLNRFLRNFFKKELDKQYLAGAITEKPNKKLEISKSSSPNPFIDEADYWAMASNEFNSKRRNQGLWAKCFSQCEGDENKAKAMYLSIRFEELRNEAPPGF